MNSPDPARHSTHPLRTKSPWLNPRRKRFWFVVVVALYTLVGFFVVPLIVKNSVLDLIQEDLGRTAHIEAVEFNPYLLSLGVHGFEMNDTDGVRLAAFGEFSVDFQLSTLLRRAWTFGEIRMVGFYFYFERFNTSDTRLNRLLTDVARDQHGEPAVANGGKSTWGFNIDELVLEGGSLDLADQNTTPTANIGIRSLQIKLTGINSQDGKRSPLSLSGSLEEGGGFGLDGSLRIAPEFSLTGNARTRGLALSAGEPYAQQYARVLIETGYLDSDVEISATANEDITVSGAIQVTDLEVKDTIENERLLGWNELDIDHFDLNLTAGNLRLSHLVFAQLFSRIVIFKDLSTNLASLVNKPTEGSTEADEDTSETTKTNQFNIIVGGIRVDDGAMEFSDLSLPLPFATFITNLNGAVSSIATNSSEPANIKLEGQVDEYGLARIDGTINMFDPVQHTGIVLEFRNLLMSELSPYTIQFAGHEIDEGRLDLELQYAIDEGRLQGSNDIVISDLLLGGKIEHPDAASLPLGLAVALLKDANGVIDIDLPVEGDINDPEFRVGGVIWKAFTGLITRVATAPFRLLGKLISSDTEDLGEFQFLAGRFDLTPPELEKITQLEEALRLRPNLVVEVSGVIDPTIDIPALKYIHLHAILLTLLGEDSKENDDETMLLDTETRPLLESLFKERYPDAQLATLKAQYMTPATNEAESKAVLDELAYVAKLKDRLMAAEIIGEHELVGLAQARAEIIKTAFRASGKLDEHRVRIVKPREVVSEDGEWVKLELAVANG